MLMRPRGWTRSKDRDMAKALITAGLARVLYKDGAKMATLDARALEPRLPAGEILHLGDRKVTRVT
jgi:hypothetical protein